MSHAHHQHEHHDHGAHGHAHGTHGHAPTVSARNERVVLTGFLLTAGFMLVEVVGGVLSGSLALIADAGHMLTDAAALALAWVGFRIGRRASDARRTFGYMRFEVLAGLVNAMTLFALVAWIVWEAVQRLRSPGEVLAGPMLAVAVVGLLVNCLVFWILHRGDQSHVNIRGATLHVLGDLLGSVAAIVAALVIHFTGWMPIDPILSVLVCLLILRSAWSLLRGAFHILMEGTPPDIDIGTLRAHLIEEIDGVAAVDHVHVWSITSGKVLATLELTLAEDAEPARVVPAVKQALAGRFAIGHTTVEVVHAPQAQCTLERGDGPGAAHAHTADDGDAHGHAGHVHDDRGPAPHGAAR
ncbi:cation diffusion facilitator family transporter [Luteimonas sp. BDR2-5]|uniref:cation diffusion facilitator family transporter n=1 Tax=Proluteimonas luteida TaxID=2878685 RepID=UPI001E4771AD|nr:cation diffusion facilitator family transporter [Luteimonas sp. BDR2-5]MCD9029804.1 cation diffusion facilitator family transporter [Luteimonas sp. BDR2-5]